MLLLCPHDIPSRCWHAQLVVWWSGFKERLTAMAAWLNKAAQGRRLGKGVRTEQAMAALQQAEQAAFAAPQDPQATAALVDAQAELAAAVRADAGPAAQAARKMALWDGERPCAGLTAFVRSTSASPPPVCLQAPDGTRVSEPGRLPATGDCRLLAGYQQGAIRSVRSRSSSQGGRQSRRAGCLGGRCATAYTGAGS